MKRWVPAAVLALTAPLLTGCTQAPTPIGLRYEDGRLAAYFPVCPGDRLTWIRIHDNRAAGGGWWWYDPVTPEAAAGKVYLDDPARFARTEGEPLTPLPAQVYVVYATGTTGTASRAFDLADVPLRRYAPDEWWSNTKASREAKMVRELDCGKG